MGFYQEHVPPRVRNKVMARPPTREVRARVCAGLAVTPAERADAVLSTWTLCSCAGL